ncbi:hypothetical protein DQ226_17900 [Dietzia maris]|uniref:Mycothiol-dependent maleylpyruvate isomerase metal-binding domain-containing protein n=1 Tax=Dietzia maris TaxID=37915 RepID=A0A365P644_9ACTN|nr:hypothetical protein DQ226_17900 [Dietzia maris]
MTSRLAYSRMLDALEAQVGLVRYALAGDGLGTGADVTAPVASCPGWSVHDLVVHLGAVNWWGAATVREATPDTRTGGRGAVMESAPPVTEGAAALADWYSGLTAEMMTTFTDTAPDALVWTFSGPGAPTSGRGASSTRPSSTAGTSRTPCAVPPRRRPCPRTSRSTRSTSSVP